MASSESLPVLYVRAKSHYEVGLAIGKTFKSQIQDYIQVSDYVKTLKDFYGTEEGKSIVEGYLATAKKCHPKIVSEIQGMADGSGVNFSEFFLLQLVCEIVNCHSLELPKVAPPKQTDEEKGCTDVLVNRKKARIIGHNEDWRSDVSSLCYMVHVTITDDAGNIVEQFISYSYPGYLTGMCFGMNRSLVITIDGLTPKRANTNGVPISILLRCLFACSTIEECVAAMENKPFGCAFGKGINIAEIHTNRMCTVEVYPNQVIFMESCCLTETHIHEVPHESENNVCYYSHTNYYKQVEAVEVDGRKGSRLRDKRANELFPVNDIEDVKKILGDTKEEFEPIYRKPSPKHWAPMSDTCATGIFDIANKLLHVYRSNPKLAQSPCLTIPFL